MMFRKKRRSNVIPVNYELKSIFIEKVCISILKLDFTLILSRSNLGCWGVTGGLLAFNDSRC